jgi:hypothetical protein
LKPSGIAPEFGVCVVVHQKERRKHVQLVGLAYRDARRIDRRWRSDLAYGSLHFRRIRLRKYPIEVQIEGRFVNAVEIFRVSECIRSAIGETQSLIRLQLAILQRVLMLHMAPPVRLAPRQDGFPVLAAERGPRYENSAQRQARGQPDCRISHYGFSYWGYRSTSTDIQNWVSAPMG